MKNNIFCPFGKTIKKRLIDLEKDQVWLIGEVRQKTGLYFDSSYLYKIMIGKLQTPSIKNAICEILELSQQDHDTAIGVR